uniref:Glucose 1-dehydrogenase related protein n=1 Tax=Thermoplasma acidophilum TaxID=2303 RepID=UPI00018BF9C4|nr:Chain A, Glucose 1-dehydrogenase related protein [Thermoplasma acidophilum]2ZK7_B Chain B, Glucose 1-dehydrogenase related protein [Thermoplasma acidophilum]
MGHHHHHHMFSDLRDKVVIVTGASMGIGRAIAERFVDEGSKVIDLSIHDPGEAKYDHIECDVTNPDQVKASIDHIFKEYGSISVLVNNAGIESYGKIESMSMGEWRRIIDVNLFGYYYASKFAIPYMIRSRDPSIVNISSVQASIITKNASAYVTSKHAVIGLTKSIALDYAPLLRCNAVCPATIDTPLVRKAAELEVGSDPMRIEKKISEWGHEHPMQRIGKPQEVASAVAFLASREASFITGTCLYVDGGLSIRA